MTALCPDQYIDIIATLSTIGGYDTHSYNGTISNGGIVNNTFTLLIDTEYTASIVLSHIATDDYELIEYFSKL